MSILNIPIQINGGGLYDEDTEEEVKQLKERELYINTSSYNLYCGREGTKPVKVNCGNADSATSAIVLGGSNKFAWIDSENSRRGARIGNIMFYENRCEPKDNNVVTLKDFNVSNLQSLTLSSNVYGKNLPSNPVNGQVFFKI